MKILLKNLFILNKHIYSLLNRDKFKVDTFEYNAGSSDYNINYTVLSKRNPLKQSAINIYRNKKLLSGFCREDVAEISLFAGISIEKKRIKKRMQTKILKNEEYNIKKTFGTFLPLIIRTIIK